MQARYSFHIHYLKVYSCPRQANAVNYRNGFFYQKFLVLRGLFVATAVSLSVWPGSDEAKWQCI